MAREFFTADTHFGSLRHLEFCKRPFKTVEEMDAALIKNWNDIVADNDIVYHLGDFGDYNVANRLNGKIILLAGNYERVDISKNHKDDITSYRSKMHRCYNINVIMNDLVHLPTHDLYICHEPSKRKVDAFNLFGHIHAAQMVKNNGLNVGTDCHHLRPISSHDVNFYRNAIKKHYDKEVFMK